MKYRMRSRINPSLDYLWCVHLLHDTLLHTMLILLQETLGPLKFPALVFGAASFSYQYNNDDHLASFTPVRTVRLALRCVHSVLTWSAQLTIDGSVMAFVPSTHPPIMALLRSSWVRHSKHYGKNFPGLRISWCVMKQ